MSELFPRLKPFLFMNHKTVKQLSMYFSMNKALALALSYSGSCGFEYDLLIAGRPDVLLGMPLSFYDGNGEETLLHRALPPHNEILHSFIIVESTGSKKKFGDFHYIFNPTTARTFVEKMFPPPDQNWPDLAKLKIKLACHTGWVQEFALNNGIVMSNHGIGPPNEEVARKIWDTNYPTELKTLSYLEHWREKLNVLGLPDHCFPSAPDGWKIHTESDDPQCFPKYYDAQGNCPPNQNVYPQTIL